MEQQWKPDLEVISVPIPCEDYEEQLSRIVQALIEYGNEQKSKHAEVA